ncbi:MAG: TerC family protein [Verrucomicrobia bacterium]|nr:TerC family protein [Verrucomicrobiota bacterium]
MPAHAAITPWHWVGFVGVILVLLALDLGAFHRHAHVVGFKEAFAWTAAWFLLAMLFPLALTRLGLWQGEPAIEYLTGYLVELSLSLDNVFVIAVIFAWFRVPPALQHRSLFWGILGALLMRGLMIGLGVALVRQFSWVLYLFGALLLVSGLKLCAAGQSEVRPERNLVLRLTRRVFSVTEEFDGQQFLVRRGGRWSLTPLALVLVTVESADLVFALDSIPAVFGVTQRPFVIFTSNVFAILGLRSLYFVLAGAISYFRFLKVGLALVLVFIGAKMLAAPWLHLPTLLSLATVVGILLVAIVASLVTAWGQDRP